MPNAGLLSSAEKIGEWNKVELNVTSEHWHQLTSFNRYRHRYELSLAATALHQDTKHAYIDWKSHAVGNTPLKSKHSHSFTHSLTHSLYLSWPFSSRFHFLTQEVRTRSALVWLPLIAAFLQLTPWLWHSSQGAACKCKDCHGNVECIGGSKHV